MPVPTPFHPRTSEICVSYKWKDWAGYYAPCQYGLSPEREYNAIRLGAALLDVSPLYKYDVDGPDAARFLSRMMVRDIAKLGPGRMTYLCWCDDHGKVLDDGTVANLGDGRYRVTSAAPALHWFLQHARPFDVRVRDLSDSVAALALQGPTSRDILRQICNADMDNLRFFGVCEAEFDGFRGLISRTGYTGDLGYEIWVDNQAALPLYDLLLNEGEAYNIEPVGLDALDISRVEAGFILRGVDYTGANDSIVDEQRSSPFEIGLGWTVKLKNREPFIGQAALQREKERGSAWSLVGLDVDWLAVEALYDRLGLPPSVPSASWRSMIPIYCDGRQVGRATSGTWSPTLKRNLALASVESAYAKVGTRLSIEWTVEWSRHTVPATVVKTPFFDPARKKA